MALVTFFTWRAKFGGMIVPDTRRLLELEAESTKLKRPPAKSLLEAEALKVALGLIR